ALVGAGVEVEEAAELFLHPGDVVLEALGGEELALDGSSAGIANQSGRAAGECERTVARQLKAAKAEKRNEIADMETVSGRIETGIKSDGTARESLLEFLGIGAVGDQAAPGQVFNDTHKPAIITISSTII